MAHIHKRFTDDQVKELIERYMKKEIEQKYVQEILGIGKARCLCLAATLLRQPKRILLQIHQNKSMRILIQQHRG